MDHNIVDVKKKFELMCRKVDWERTWQWVTNGDLKGCTESLIFSAQEQALRTNYIKFHIDKTIDSPSCRMCGERGESVDHLVSECSKLAQRENKFSSIQFSSVHISKFLYIQYLNKNTILRIT